MGLLDLAGSIIHARRTSYGFQRRYIAFQGLRCDCRFSEDVDITLDYRAFEEGFDPFAEGVNRTKIKQFSDRLKFYVSAHANEVVVPYLENELAKLPTAEQHTVELDDGGEKIWVTYPSVVEGTGEHIRS